MSVQEMMDYEEATSRDTGIDTLAPNPYDIPPLFEFKKDGKTYRIDTRHDLKIYAGDQNGFFFHSQERNDHISFDFEQMKYGCVGCLLCVFSTIIMLILISLLFGYVWSLFFPNQVSLGMAVPPFKKKRVEKKRTYTPEQKAKWKEQREKNHTHEKKKIWNKKNRQKRTPEQWEEINRKKREWYAKRKAKEKGIESAAFTPLERSWNIVKDDYEAIDNAASPIDDIDGDEMMAEIRKLVSIMNPIEQEISRLIMDGISDDRISNALEVDEQDVLNVRLKLQQITEKWLK